LLLGEFSAIDKYGKLIVQQTSNYPFMAGENIFVRIMTALQVVAGHFASDVATKKGLPAPLMPFLSFVQSGSIGEKGRTVADMSRAMYHQGYDFRHFIACSIQVIIIEAIVRIGFFAKSVFNGNSFKDSIPFGNKPKLRTQLFLANTIAIAMNAGKIAVTQSPLSLNWAQWLSFFRYLIPQAAWVLWGKDEARHRYILDAIDDDRQSVIAEVNMTWNEYFPHAEQAVV